MKKKTNMTNAALTGMMIGAAVGMATNTVIKSKKRKIAKKAGKAINAIGEVMQNVTSYMK